MLVCKIENAHWELRINRSNKHHSHGMYEKTNKRNERQHDENIGRIHRSIACYSKSNTIHSWNGQRGIITSAVHGVMEGQTILKIGIRTKNENRVLL